MTTDLMSVGDYLCPTHEQTNKQTNEQTAPFGMEYISVRVTIPHDLFPELRDGVLNGIEEYIAYPHVGKSKNNPHFHILVPAGQISDASLRQRLKRHGTGNKCYSIKQFANGLLCGIQYASREGTDPVVRGPRMHDAILAAPAWVPRDSNIGSYLEDKSKRRRLDEFHHYTITFRNIEKITLDYRKRKGIKSDQLEDTLEAMHADNYRLDRQLTERGIPATIYDEFTAKCHGNTTWKAGRFARMRIAPTWMSI